jgi:hypothetical protein
MHTSPFSTNRPWLPVSILLAFAMWSSPTPAQCTTSWSSLGAGSDEAVISLLAGPTGTLIAAGYFSSSAGPAANGIASWDGTAWTALGSGVGPAVTSLALLPSGDVIAGGVFTTAGGTPANFIARWNGVSWSALGSGLSGMVFAIPWALITMPNGDLIAGGNFVSAGGVTANGIARWNGASWSALGSGMGASADVRALAILPNGDLIAGGLFTTAGGGAANRIARWNGSTWSALASGMNGTVSALLTLETGDLVAGGQFTTAGGDPASGIAVWNGTSWAPLGSGVSDNIEVRALASLPNGDIVASGFFDVAGGVQASRIARWNGVSWSAIDTGLNDGGIALTSMSNGDLVVGGRFTTAGGVAANRIARLTSTCPATSVSNGTGCPSSGGSNLLNTATLPWLDATFRATATGLPPSALVISVHGFSAFSQGAHPLSLDLPLAGAGCDLLVSADIIEALTTTTGSVQSEIFVPHFPPILGMNFYHQMIPIELDGSGNFVAVSATNSLRLTVGTF